MIKKISAVVLALVMCVGMFAGCGKKNSEKKDSAKKKSGTTTDAEDTAGPEMPDATAADVPDPSLTIDGSKIDTTDYVMCTIDGFDINFDEFRFYYYYNLDTYTTTYGITADSLKENEETFNTFLSDVILVIEQELVAEKLAKENGIELDDDDQKYINDTIDAAKASYDSEEAYIADLKSAYLTEDLYRKMLERAQIYTKVIETLFEGDGKYATSQEDFKALIQNEDEYAHEIHVMVPFYATAELDDSSAEGYDDLTLSEKITLKSNAYDALDADAKEEAKAAAEEIANEVCEKANNGDDFEGLIAEYGWDIGLEDPSAGYYISKDNLGGYPEELVTEAFGLKVGEVSEEPILNSVYGYFIVKRIEPDMDYVQENIESMIKSYDSTTIQEVFQEQIEAMSVTYCDNWDKITAESVT